MGRGLVTLPAFENHAGAKGKITAVVVQHLEDEIEDGHEVMFQTEAPGHEYHCLRRGGGFNASDPAGADRLPLLALPEGLRLSDLEGAGEVQTPLLVPPGVELALGDPVFFRPAKAGEQAEHFQRDLPVRGAAIEAQIDTYRGAGQCSH